MYSVVTFVAGTVSSASFGTSGAAFASESRAASTAGSVGGVSSSTEM